MPPEQGVGLDEETSPSPAGKQPRRSGEQCPVGRLERWSVDLAPEHRHLRGGA
ncbi:MAG: hypothetical protein ACRDZX_05635 [Acidimicrobiales bacterium]